MICAARRACGRSWMKGVAMSLRSRTRIAFAGLLAAATFVTSADAGQWRHRPHPGFHNHNQALRKVVVRQRVDVRQRVVVNFGRGYGTMVRATNSYSGDVSIAYKPGVGTWSYGTSSTLQTRPLASRSGAKIIHLQGGANDCSMEKGVCVIRP